MAILQPLAIALNEPKISWHLVLSILLTLCFLQVAIFSFKHRYLHLQSAWNLPCLLFYIFSRRNRRLNGKQRILVRK